MPALVASRKNVSKNLVREAKKLTIDLCRTGSPGSASTTSAGSSGAPNQFHTPSPTVSRKTRANGSLISGSSLSVSAARAAATPSAVAPTLSVISQLSSSVLTTCDPIRKNLGHHDRQFRADIATTPHRAACDVRRFV